MASCFSFVRRQRGRCVSRTVAPVTVSEPQLFDIDTEEEEDDVYCGNINTFALVKSKAGGFHRGRPSHREKNDTRLVILPYFGRFAGRWVTCEIDRGRCEKKRLDTGTLPTTFDPNYVHKRVYMYNLLYIILYIIQEHFQRPLNPIIYKNAYCIIYYTVYYIYQYSITFLGRLSCVNTSTSQTI